MPDGRSIQVTLSGREGIFADLRRAVVEAIQDGGHTGSTSSREASRSTEQRPINVKVDMNVTTPDAQSFGASRQQLMQRLHSDMTQAVRQLGSLPAVDDPTVRRGE